MPPRRITSIVAGAKSSCAVASASSVLRNETSRHAIAAQRRAERTACAMAAVMCNEPLLERHLLHALVA